MGNKLLINGQTFTGLGEIQSWDTQQQPAGIRVDWGGGDVDILTGESWEISQIFDKSLVTINRTGFSNWTYSFPGLVTSMTVERPKQGYISSRCNYSTQTYFMIRVDNGDTRRMWNAQGCREPWANLADGLASGPFHNYDCFPSCRVDPRNWFVYQESASYRSAGVGNSGSISLVGIEYIPGQITVTTNTGASSSRTTSNPPNVSLASGDCILTIIYTDNTTQELTYSECPTVVPYEEPDCPLPCALADKVISALRG